MARSTLTSLIQGQAAAPPVAPSQYAPLANRGGALSSWVFTGSSQAAEFLYVYQVDLEAAPAQLTFGTAPNVPEIGDGFFVEEHAGIQSLRWTNPFLGHLVGFHFRCQPRVSPVPEPASTALFVTGCLVVGLYGARLRRTQAL